jgi:hypothetical protein
VCKRERVWEDEGSEVTGEWKLLHNEDHNLYSSPIMYGAIRRRHAGFFGEVTPKLMISGYCTVTTALLGYDVM